MKQFLKILFIFSVAFFVMDKLFYFQLNQIIKNETDQRLDLLINSKINKDVIILGSSRAQFNIMAHQLERNTKLSCYNLGYKGASLEFQLFVLKTLLKHNENPKQILLLMDDNKMFVKEKTLGFRNDKLFPMLKYQYYTNKLIDNKQISPFAYFLFSARLNINSFNFDNQFNQFDEVLPCGSSPLLGNSNKANFTFLNNNEYDEKAEIKEKLNQFKTIQQICDKQQIKLTLIFPPNYKNLNANFVARINKLKLAKTKIFIYNQNNKAYFNKHNFFDESHLNQIGASIFTQEIAQHINIYK